MSLEITPVRQCAAVRRQCASALVSGHQASAPVRRRPIGGAVRAVHHGLLGEERNQVSAPIPVSAPTGKEKTMTRSRASAKAAGSRAERAVADYLAAQLQDDRIDRRVKRGNKDRGDISGLRLHGQRLVAEVKDCARMELPAWTSEAHTEAGNDDALTGVVIAKRRGTTDVGKWWVVMTTDDLLALLDGQRHGHRKDGAA